MVRIENSPSTGNINLVIASSLLQRGQSLQLKITDELGKLVWEKKNIREQRTSISKNEIASGIYFFSLLDGNTILGNGRLIFQ